MKKKTILQVLVVLITIVLWVIPTEWFGIDGLTVIQQRTLAIFVFAALMWLFEIIPAWATSVTTIVALLFAVSDKGFLIESAGTTVSYREIMASLIVYVAICCSLAMTLPISTPPNAIASSTGLVQTKDMVKVGLTLGIIGGVLGYILIVFLFY